MSYSSRREAIAQHHRIRNQGDVPCSAGSEAEGSRSPRCFGPVTGVEGGAPLGAFRYDQVDFSRVAIDRTGADQPDLVADAVVGVERNDDDGFTTEVVCNIDQETFTGTWRATPPVTAETRVDGKAVTAELLQPQHHIGDIGCIR